VTSSRTAALQAARRQRREAALALRPSQCPSAPAPDRLRVATWNVNSLRARARAVERLLERTLPDVLLLQETKAAHVVEAATEVLQRYGYSVAHVGSGSYNGVAVAARHPISDELGSGALGDHDLDREPRVASCVVYGPTPLRAVSVYVPHGREVGHWHYDFKLAFLRALAAQVRRWASDGIPLVLGGDVNIAPTDSDVFHPEPFVGSTHVTPAEREALAEVVAAGGLADLDVLRWGADARRFTWWRYGIGYSRNLGMRIDLLLASHALAARLDTTWIDHVERGADKPSDHAALLADLHLPDGLSAS
jgi:exodeoxyribonuclease-3